MAYLGRFRLGDTVPLFICCTNALGTPTFPVDSPNVKLWDPLTGLKVQSIEIPVIDRYAQTGLFEGELRLSALYSNLGLWSATYTYMTADGNNGLKQDTFEIVEGGNPDGNVVSMSWYERPWANFIVQELDSGKLVQGRNPKL
jgi:hypothetical protein